MLPGNPILAALLTSLWTLSCSPPAPLHATPAGSTSTATSTLTHGSLGSGTVVDGGSTGTPATPDERWDIVVIGAGPAGLAVASQLGDALVLDAGTEVGGRALLAGAEMLFVDTPEQQAAGITDSVDQALAEWPSFTGAEPTDSAVDFLNASVDTYDRLSKLGLSFTSPVAGPLMPTPRLQALNGEGKALVAALLASVPGTVTVRTSTWVQDLVVEDGQVLGVLTADAYISAQTVVVASGGFASNSEILDALGANDEGSAWWAAGDSTATGDAITWAQAHDLGIGCGECMGWLRNTLPVSDADGQAFFLLGPDIPWIWVDSAGARFVDESHTESITYTAALQSHQPVWSIAPKDALLNAVTSSDGRVVVQAAIDAGEGFTCAEDDASLATLLAIDSDGLAVTLADLATARLDGTIDSVGRDPLTLPVFGNGPICAYQSGRIAAKSFGGLSVDREGRVLSADGDVIGGLYAVGEAAGMAAPGIGGIAGFDGSLSAVVWSGWRVGAALAR